MDVKAKTVRLPDGLAERLRTAAFVQRRSQTSLIIEAVDRFLLALDQLAALDQEEADGGS